MRSTAEFSFGGAILSVSKHQIDNRLTDHASLQKTGVGV